MAKKNSSNNDINSILEQLKKSYNIENTQEPEEDVFEAESYEDTELSSLLAKIIAENTVEKESVDTLDIEDIEDETEAVQPEEKKNKNKKDIEPEQKPASHTIRSEDFVSVLEQGEDISEGAKYATPHPALRVIEGSKPQSIDAVDEQISDQEDLTEELDQHELPVSGQEINEIFEESDETAKYENAEEELVGNVNDGEALEFDDLDDDTDIDDDITFGDIQEEIEDDEDDITFGELEEDQDVETADIDDGLTFGDLEDDDEDDNDVTFGELENDKDIDRSDIDDDLTFADLEDNETSEDDGSDNAEADDIDFPIAAQEVLDTEAQASEYKQPIYDDPAETKKYYYDVLEKENRDISDVNTSDEQNYVKQSDISPKSENKEPRAEVKEDIILGKDEYTFDPLQWHFDRKKKVIVSDILEDEESEPSKKTSEIQDDDISLLLQLGYKKELHSEVGSERTNSVVQNISNSYRPDKNKIPFGFCGKEFSEKDQVDKIKQRYDYDKRMIIVKTALFSAIAFVLLLLGILFKTRTDVASMIIFPLIELFIMALGCVVIYKELFSGIMGIFKFSPTLFTIPIFSLAVLLVYDIFVIAVSTSESKIDLSSTNLFGFTCALFFVFSLTAQLFNCIRENQTFNLISSSDELYCGEMLISKSNPSNSDNLRAKEIRKQVKGDAVVVKKTKYISEYFKRSSESTYGIFNVALTIGIVLIISIILAYIIIATQNKAGDVASTIIFTIYTSLSVSFILTMPTMLFSAFGNLKRKKTAFIGTGAINEYSQASSVIFKDTQAYRLGSDIEIVPFGNGDMKASLKTANRLFTALDGTMLQTINSDTCSTDESVSVANINIAIINNDGVELYMDNETHILLGNEKFMSAYRKKMNFDACDFIPSIKTRDKEVIYLAINWNMSLGYIMSLKLKKNFMQTIKLLSSENIRTIVGTYEPHIKPIHASEIDIGVYKPYEYEAPDKTTSRFGGIVASEDGTNIIYPLLMSKEIAKRTKTLSWVSLLIMLSGVIVSLAVTLIGYLIPGAQGVLSVRYIFTAVAQIASLIPMTVHSVGIYKKFR